MYKHFLIIGLIIISTTSYSQENFNNSYHYQKQDTWGSIGLSLGGQFPNYKNLDRILDTLGYGKTPSGLIGGGFWLELGKGKIFCELGGVFSTSNPDKSFENENSKLTIQGAKGVISVGYKFDLGNGFYFYPKIGIAGGTNDFLISTKTEINSNFTTVLDSVRTQQTVSNYYLNQTIGGIFLFPSGDLSHIGIDFMFGLPPFKDRWDYNDILLSNTPKSNPALFSLNIRYIFYFNDRSIDR